MAGPETAICDLALAGSAPDWVHLFPPGKMTARDGRHFNLVDPEAVIAAFAAGAIDLPVDYEHQSENDPRSRSGPVPAAGWIRELKADASGLWGRVDWTAQARELIASKAYRYLSPSFFYNKAGKAITKLKGAGLVHTPALHLTALASQEDDMNDETGFMDQLLALLNLPERASEDDILSAIEKLAAERDPARPALASVTQNPDPARFVPIEAVQELMVNRGQERSQYGEARTKAKISDALGKGYITPGMVDWATALCVQDEASFDGFVASNVPAYAYLSQTLLPDHPPDRAQNQAQSGTAAAICAQLGLKADALKD